jgi:hypothetical protein
MFSLSLHIVKDYDARLLESKGQPWFDNTMDAIDDMLHYVPRLKHVKLSKPEEGDDSASKKNSETYLQNPLSVQEYVKRTDSFKVGEMSSLMNGLIAIEKKENKRRMKRKMSHSVHFSSRSTDEVTSVQEEEDEDEESDDDVDSDDDDDLLNEINEMLNDEGEQQSIHGDGGDGSGGESPNSEITLLYEDLHSRVIVKPKKRSPKLQNYLLSEEAKEAKVILDGIDKFYAYNFSSPQSYLKDFKEWEREKDSLYTNFLVYHKKVYKLKNEVMIERMLQYVEDNRVESLRMVILRAIFNGKTRLRLVKHRKDDAIFKIESKNLVESMPINIVFQSEYFVIPSVRYRDIRIQMPLDTLIVAAIYPNIPSTTIQYDSYLKDKGISLEAQMHYGTVRGISDMRLLMCAFVEETLVSVRLDHMKKGLPVLIQSEWEISLNEGLYAIFKPSPPAIEDINKIDDMHIILKGSLVRMSFRHKEKESHRKGLISFELVDNGASSTFTVNDILNINTTSNRLRGLHVLLFDNAPVALPTALQDFIEKTSDHFVESDNAIRMQKDVNTPFVNVYLAAIYSYYVNYLEVERDKTTRKLRVYGVNERVLYDENCQFDDWMSLCHSFKLSDECRMSVCSTFSLSHGVMRIKLHTIMTQSYYNSLVV